MMVSPDLNCQLSCKTILLMIVHVSSCFAALASCVFVCKSIDWFKLLNVSSHCYSCSTNSAHCTYVQCIHMCNHADWPHEMQQLRCVLLVYWISDAKSQGRTDLQSLVNLNCLHCGESDTISRYAKSHQAVRCNEVH